MDSVFTGIQYCAMWQCTIQHSTVQYSTVQYSSVQYSSVQYSSVQLQYSTVQYRRMVSGGGSLHIPLCVVPVGCWGTPQLLGLATWQQCNGEAGEDQLRFGALMEQIVCCTFLLRGIFWVSSSSKIKLLGTPPLVQIKKPIPPFYYNWIIWPPCHI